MSVIVLVCVISTCRAEYYSEMGERAWTMREYLKAVQLYNRAAQADPWSIAYTQRQLDTLHAAAPLIGMDSLVRVATISESLAGRACRIHPYDPLAHEMLAIAFIHKGIATGWNALAAADEEMGIAQELAPNCISYLTRREKLAAQMGVKRPEIAEAIKRLRVLTKNRPGA